MKNRAFTDDRQIHAFKGEKKVESKSLSKGKKNNGSISIISDMELETEYIQRNCIKPGDLILDSSKAARHLKSMLIKNRSQEKMVVLFLNAANKLIISEILFTGTLTTSVVYPREIIRRALENSAAALIIGHNHPSGTLKPSKDDLAITKRIKQALKAVDIKLHDHIIIGFGRKSYYSFGDMGLL